jgi:hypothetical protein
MKRGWIVLLMVLLIGVGSIVWEFRGAVYFIVMMALEPKGWGCDEGLVADRQATNRRGDLVAEYLRACTGFGTIVDYSIVLKLQGEEETTTLMEHSDPRYDFPKFRWIDNDTLMIDLGKVSWLRSPVHNVGRVKITYAYSMGE